MQQRIVSREEWLDARRELLAEERRLTHALDSLRAQRRALPWVAVETPYVFNTRSGPVSLGELFAGRSQLAIYNFMLTPGSDSICNGCALIADHVDAARQHFEQADLSFAAVSRVGADQIESAKARLGWTFEWVSSQDNSFNYDFGVSFTPADLLAGRAVYNYGTVLKQSQDMFGAHLFIKNDAGVIFHTYSTYHRGADLLIGAFNWLDLAPKGRNETGTMSWVKLHDQY